MGEKRVLVVGELHGEDLTLEFDMAELIAEFMGWVK